MTSPPKIMRNRTAAMIGPQSSSGRHGSSHRLWWRTPPRPSRSRSIIHKTNASGFMRKEPEVDGGVFELNQKENQKCREVYATHGRSPRRQPLGCARPSGDIAEAFQFFQPWDGVSPSDLARRVDSDPTLTPSV